MTKVELLNFIASSMSAIAAIAASVAAIVALRISRKANALSEKSNLATHHQTAALVLSKSIDEMHRSTRDLARTSYDLWADWPRTIESKDDRSRGGLNPRPLRHVLSNGSEMLLRHGASKGKWFQRAQRSMFSIIRDGVCDLSDSEYEVLLKKADHCYSDFEGVLGRPSQNKKIVESDAFRWVCHQLARRVTPDDWRNVWAEAWLPDGFIGRYQSEYSKVRPILEKILLSLSQERNNIQHSVFPLASNPILNNKYEKVVTELEVLLEDCDLALMEGYRNWPHEEEISQFVLYVMGVAYLVMGILDSIGSESGRADGF